MTQPSMEDQSSPLEPEWQQWLAENLVRGVAHSELVKVLVAAGAEEKVAREALAAELRDPYLQGALQVAHLQWKLEGLLEIYRDLFQQSGSYPQVPRHHQLPPSEFFERYYFRNLPVVVGGAMEDWPALGRWTWERATTQLGGLQVEPSSQEAASTTLLTVSEWVRRLSAGEPGLARWASAPLLEREELHPLASELCPPRGYAARELRASEPRLWLEAAGAELAPRPARKNLLLCQLSGRRSLQLIPSFELPLLRGVTAPPDHGAASASAPLVLEVALEAGELVLIPVGWWYGSRAPEPGLWVSFEAFDAPEPNTPWKLPEPGEASPTPYPEE
jgi:hypothetical protein